jgi:hypothetical protein
MSAPVAARYRDTLLRDLGADAAPAAVGDEHPARRWARSGLMSLTGHDDAAPLMSPLPIAACADGALAALASLAPHTDLADIDAAGLLSERAAHAGLRRAGRVSCGGACRLLPTVDGTLALSLARDDDWTLLPAWLECEATSWADVERAVRERSGEALLERGRELGLALALSGDGDDDAAWCSIVGGASFGDAARAAAPRRPPRVVDLSSLWAGPLCTHLLQRCGAEVVKCESATRPDGARRGAAGPTARGAARRRSSICSMPANAASRSISTRRAAARNYASCCCAPTSSSKRRVRAPCASSASTPTRYCARTRD